MHIEVPYALVRESFNVLIMVGGPIFATVVVMGLVIGALQAATQINDPALSFVPRIGALMAVLATGGTFLLDTLVGFFVSAATRF